jgi:hypothetical protein
MSHPRVKLSVGPSAAIKAVVVGVSLVILAVAVFVALIAYGLSLGEQTSMTSSIANDDFNLDPRTNELTGTEITAGVVGAICSLLFVAIAVYLMLRVLRAGAWLQGSVLHVRGAIRSRSQDLAKARISGGTKVTPGDQGRVQVITASDPASGRSLTLPLRGGGGMLPGDQLRMLANAMTNQRVRSGDDDQAYLVAERLREFASDPFS